MLRLPAFRFIRAPACTSPGLAAARGELAAPHYWSVLAASGTAADYPANVFSVDAGASPRGTGRSLRTADGRAGFTLFVLPNCERDSPRRYLRRHLTIPRIAYRAVTDRFFVVSGYDRDRVFYSRCDYPRGASGPMQCIGAATEKIRYG